MRHDCTILTNKRRERLALGTHKLLSTLCDFTLRLILTDRTKRVFIHMQRYFFVFVLI